MYCRASRRLRAPVKIVCAFRRFAADGVAGERREAAGRRRSRRARTPVAPRAVAEARRGATYPGRRRPPRGRLLAAELPGEFREVVLDRREREVRQDARVRLASEQESERSPHEILDVALSVALVLRAGQPDDVPRDRRGQDGDVGGPAGVRRADLQIERRLIHLSNAEMTKRGCPYSTGAPPVTSTSAICPSAGAVISAMCPSDWIAPSTAPRFTGSPLAHSRERLKIPTALACTRRAGSFAGSRGGRATDGARVALATDTATENSSVSTSIREAPPSRAMRVRSSMSESASLCFTARASSSAATTAAASAPAGPRSARRRPPSTGSARIARRGDRPWVRARAGRAGR